MTEYYKTPIKSGVALKCGRCGTGTLFRAYLKFRPQCLECGQSFTVADTADGPAFFVGFLAMILFAPVFIAVRLMATSATGMALGYILTGLGCLVFCLGLLPVFKGVLFNLQIQHSAEEGRFEYTGSHGSAPENWRKR